MPRETHKNGHRRKAAMARRLRERGEGRGESRMKRNHERAARQTAARKQNKYQEEI